MSSRPKIVLKNGSTWPSVVIRNVNGVQVKAALGYGSAASAVPSPIKEAIKIGVSRLYQHRGDDAVDEGLPKTAQLLLEPYRAWRL